MVTKGCFSTERKYCIKPIFDGVSIMADGTTTYLSNMFPFHIVKGKVPVTSQQHRIWRWIADYRGA